LSSENSLEMRYTEGLLSVVIPCFKSPKTLEKLVEEISTNLVDEWETEILLVCDSNPDQTWERILRIAKDNKRVKGVLLGVNVGQHVATGVGLKMASGELAMTIDDDFIKIGQPARKMFNELDSVTDLVYGVSNDTLTFSIRNVLTRFAKKSFMFFKVIDGKHQISSFRLMRRILVPETDINSVPGIEIDSILNRRSRKTKCISVDIERPTFRNSRYTLGKLLNYYLGIMFFTTEKFVRLIFLVAFSFLMISLILSLMYVALFLTKVISVPGFTSLVLLILLTSAFQLVTISIIALFIAKVSREGNKPLEIWIRESTYRN